MLIRRELWLIAIAAVAGGCPATDKSAPAPASLPPTVKILAVGEFAVAAGDGQWAQVARQATEARLAESAARPGQPALVSLAEAPAAIVRGQVETYLYRRSSTVDGGFEERLAATVAITFTVSRPDGRVILTRRLSDRRAAVERGPAPAGLAELIIDGLIRQCVERFAAGLATPDGG